MRSAREPAAIQRGAGEAVSGRAPPISLQRSPAPLPAPAALQRWGPGPEVGARWRRRRCERGATSGERAACSLAAGAGSGMAAGRRRCCEVGGGTRLRSAPSRFSLLTPRGSRPRDPRPRRGAVRCPGGSERGWRRCPVDRGLRRSGAGAAGVPVSAGLPAGGGGGRGGWGLRERGYGAPDSSSCCWLPARCYFGTELRVEEKLGAVCESSSCRARVVGMDGL